MLSGGGFVHVDKDGHELCGQEFCPLHRSIVTGERSDEPLVVFAKKKTGDRVPVEVTVAPIRDAAGRIRGGIELFRDLTAASDDLVRARMIQDSELRCPPPSDGRVTFEVLYTPCDVVGGDFYRVERLDADRYAVIVADVMGHGVAAALYTMQLRSLWDDLRSQLAEPAVFLERINSRLHALVREAGYFATAFPATRPLKASCRFRRGRPVRRARPSARTAPRRCRSGRPRPSPGWGMPPGQAPRRG